MAGHALAGGNFLFDFFFLRGDANHDGRVNLDDFNILASRFGTNLNAGRTGTSKDYDEAAAPRASPADVHGRWDDRVMVGA